MNNWLIGPLELANALRGDEANDVDFIIEMAKGGWQKHGNRLTFVAVDV